MATILAVDDEQPILELIKNGLQKDGHLVTGYTSAEQVPLDKLNRYDLVILDVMMPGTDGFSFCEKSGIWLTVRSCFLQLKRWKMTLLLVWGLALTTI